MARIWNRSSLVRAEDRVVTSLIVTQGDLLAMLEVEGGHTIDNSVSADCYCLSAVTFKANIFNTK